MVDVQAVRELTGSPGIDAASAATSGSPILPCFRPLA